MLASLIPNLLTTDITYRLSLPLRQPRTLNPSFNSSPALTATVQTCHQRKQSSELTQGALCQHRQPTCLLPKTYPYLFQTLSSNPPGVFWVSSLLETVLLWSSTLPLQHGLPFAARKQGISCLLDPRKPPCFGEAHLPPASGERVHGKQFFSFSVLVCLKKIPCWVICLHSEFPQNVEGFCSTVLQPVLSGMFTVYIHCDHVGLFLLPLGPSTHHIFSLLSFF